MATNQARQHNAVIGMYAITIVMPEQKTKDDCDG